MCKKGIFCKWVAVFIILFALNSISLANKIIYVDDDAVGANDGSSWQNAYIYLQDALSDAKNSEKPVEIRVAQGTYKPDQGAGQTAGDRNATFQLINDVTLSGGYAGLNKTDPNQRDCEKYETILSGDLADNDIDINDPDKLLDEPTRVENSLTILRGSYTDSTVVLKGFIIKGGNYNILLSGTKGTPSPGGGLAIYYGSPTISNCTFTHNSGYGGACSNSIGSNPQFTNCTFEYNKVAMYNSENCNPTIINCSFIKNRNAMGNYVGSNPIVKRCIFIENSGIHGGAIFNKCSPIFTNCMFIRNSAHTDFSRLSGNGGVIFNEVGNPIFNNCFFISNTAEQAGGVMYNIACNLVLINCTFAENSAQKGKAIAYDIQDDPNKSSIQITNTILWDGGDEIYFQESKKANITYSNIQGGREGKGNTDEDPLFADPSNNDYHLKSQAGRFDPNKQTWVQDDVTSSCIDSGDPNTPIGFEPFPNGGYINIGAYGGTAEASKSYFGITVCETIVAGDINGDCKVDYIDVLILLSHWLEEH